MKNAIIITIMTLSSLSFAARPKKSPELIKQGEAAFKQTCSVCHGDNAKSDNDLAKAMNPKPRNLVEEPLLNKITKGDVVDNLYQTITKGYKASMPAHEASVPEKDRWAIAYWIESIRTAKK